MKKNRSKCLCKNLRVGTQDKTDIYFEQHSFLLFYLLMTGTNLVKCFQMLLQVFLLNGNQIKRKERASEQPIENNRPYSSLNCASLHQNL